MVARDGARQSVAAAGLEPYLGSRPSPTPVPDAPTPIYRVGGFGPIQGGTGEFAGAAGLLTMSSLQSLFPRTFSSLYVFRFHDPQGKFRPMAGVN